MSRARAWIRLVRLPSVLTVPGDVLVGRALCDAGPVTGLIGSSALLYLGGMALNDYADRAVDAVERPNRPIPSGEVRPGSAFALAAALTCGALGLAALTGGRRAAGVTVPLALTVWSYDLKSKRSQAGPPVMALARALNVMLGAAAAPRRAAEGAALIGTHTLAITAASRREVDGGVRAVPIGVLATATGVATVAARRRRCGTRRIDGTVAAGCLAGYLLAVYDGARPALRRPGPAELQRLVGRGVLALIPLQAGLLAAAGRPVTAVGVLSAWPVARLAARRVVIT